MSNNIDKLAWLTIKNKRILCVRSRGKSTFYIPGGKRDEGESDHQALTREILEELSVNLVADSIDYYGTITAQADGKPESVMVQLSCYLADYQGLLSVNSEIEEMAWLNSGDINQCSQGAQILLKELKQKAMIT